MSRIDLPGYGIETAPAGPADEACDLCRCDGVELDDYGRCTACAPTEDELCEEYDARVRKIRASVACSCTARFNSDDAYASGYCKVHGVAWHTRWLR